MKLNKLELWVVVCSVALSTVGMVGCSKPAPTSAQVLRGARPVPAISVDLAPAHESNEAAGEAIRHAEGKVVVMGGQIEEAQRLNRKHAITIVQLRRVLGQVDAKVAQTLAALEMDMRNYAELDLRRQVTISELKDDLRDADESNKAAGKKLAYARVQTQAVRDELESYKQLYGVAVSAVGVADEFTKKAEKKARAAELKAANNAVYKKWVVMVSWGLCFSVGVYAFIRWCLPWFLRAIKGF